MKRLFLILFLMVGYLGFSQAYPQMDTYTLVPTNAPTSPVEGQTYYDQISKKVFVWDGTQWLDLVASSIDNSLSETNQFIGQDDRIIDVNPSGSLSITRGESTLASFDGNGTVTLNLQLDPYDVTWNGNVQAATKGDIYNQIESLDSDNQNAAEVPVSGIPTNYSAATQDVEAHLAGIDVALGTVGGGVPDDDSVTPAKMADVDFGDFTVTGNVSVIDANVITTAKIADAQVTQQKLANSAVNADRVEDGTLGTAELNISSGVDADGKILASDGAGGIKYVDDQTGGLSSDNQSKIGNANKIQVAYKSANFTYGASDIEVQSGADVGTKVVIGVNDGNSHEGEMQDADMGVGDVVLKQAIGTGSEIVTYFADGESGQFIDLNGNTGNQWTVTAPNRSTGIKESANLISVDVGTVSTKSFITNLYPHADAVGTADANNVTNWSSTSTNVASEAVNTDGGNFSLSTEATSNVSGNSFTHIDLSSLFTIGRTYRFTIRADGGDCDSLRWYLYPEGGGAQIQVQTITNGSMNTYTYDWVANASGIRILFYHLGSPTIGEKGYVASVLIEDVTP